MKKGNRILTGLIAAYAACVISAASCSQSPPTSNKPTIETPMATAVRYIVDDVDAAIGIYTALTELTSIRYLMYGARIGADLCNTHLGFAMDVPAGAITSGRARSLVAVAVGLISLVIGGLALRRSTRRIGTRNGRVGAIVALVLGLIGMFLSVVHLGTSTGGFGTGSGRAGAIVALVLGLIGINLGGLALARSRRPRTTD
jgi:Family of unknown function (DUF6223)